MGPPPRPPASRSHLPFSCVSSRGLRFLPPFKACGFSPPEATFFSFLEPAQGGTPVFLFQFLLSPSCFLGRSGWRRGPWAAGQHPAPPGGEAGVCEAPGLLLPGPDARQPPRSFCHHFVLFTPVSAPETHSVREGRAAAMGIQAQGGAGACEREHSPVWADGSGGGGVPPAFPTMPGRNLFSASPHSSLAPQNIL